MRTLSGITGLSLSSVTRRHDAAIRRMQEDSKLQSMSTNVIRLYERVENKNRSNRRPDPIFKIAQIAGLTPFSLVNAYGDGNEVFSPDDVNTSTTSGVSEWIGTPSGEIRRYNPWDGSIATVSRLPGVGRTRRR